jgi:hypothetical protein
MAADAAARAPDVASAQGEWEEEPAREEGGATEKKEAVLYLPDSIALFIFASASSSSSSSAGISGFSRRPLSLAIPEWSLPICASAFPFLHVNVPGAHSPALPPRLPLRDHPLPACACVHSIADARQKLAKRLFPTAAHLPPITLMVLTHLLFQLFLSPLRRLCAFPWPPAHDEPSQQHSDTQ